MFSLKHYQHTLLVWLAAVLFLWLVFKRFQ